jgi:hypothetical protein
LSGFCETNLLSLVTSWLDNIYQIKTKSATVTFHPFSPTKHTPRIQYKWTNFCRQEIEWAYGLDNDGGMKQRCYSLVHSVRILRCKLVHTYVQSLQDHPTKGTASKTFICMHGKMTGDVIPPCSGGISAKRLNG